MATCLYRHVILKARVSVLMMSFCEELAFRKLNYGKCAAEISSGLLAYEKGTY